MIDTHFHPENLGVRPVLFTIGNIEIPSYSAMVLLGLIVGIVVYYIESSKRGKFSEKSFYVLIAAFVFGSLGAKIPIWIMNYKFIASNYSNISYFLSGRTVLGGLIGGTIGVVLTKKVLKIKEKLGNQIAPAAAIGISIGRIGCFLRGCCYGIPTSLPWGVNFGDGILRHPTQIYEAIFDLGLFVLLLFLKKKFTQPGILFKIFLNFYFSFRFLIEFIRVEEVVLLGMTGFQLACILSLIYINRDVFKINIRRGVKA